MVYMLEKIFFYRISIANVILGMMAYILLQNNNLSTSSSMFFLISCLFMNHCCLSKKTTSISFMLWFFMFGGFLIHPIIYLYLGQNYFLNDYIWYGTSVFFALGFSSLVAIYLFPSEYKNLSFNKLPDTKILLIIKLILLFIIILICFLNVNFFLFYRGAENIDIHNKYIIILLKFSLLIFFPLIACWIYHNSFKERINLNLIIFFFTNCLIISAYGSRAAILLFLFLLYEIFKRNYKINSFLIFAFLTITITSLFFVSSQRGELYSDTPVQSQKKDIDKDQSNNKQDKNYSFNSHILNSLGPGTKLGNDFLQIKIIEEKNKSTHAYLKIQEFNFHITEYVLGFENFLVRFLGADGVYFVQNSIRKLNQDELTRLKEKILTEKRLKNKLSYYDDLMLPKETKRVMQEKQNSGLNIANLPGAVGFLSIFMGPFVIFIVLFKIFTILNLIEYMTTVIFKQYWTFAFIINMVLVTRFVNFGIYFADSYKIILALSLSISFFWCIYYMRLPINKYVFNFKNN